ncbi:hypothetical protein OAN24_00860 [Pseudodesulfovibrio sp.]|nr:hypothetical protein [Pseudodesulfovibrio sp.]
MTRYLRFKQRFFTQGISKFGMLLVFIFALVGCATPALANQQSPGGSVSVLNILFLGLIAYFLVRMFRRRSGDNDKTRPGNWSEESPDDEKKGRVIRPMDRHEAARQMWGHLSSDKDSAQPASPSPAASHSDFDEAEFLEGAKLFFSRFQQVKDSRELDDLRGFLSEEVYAEAVAQANPAQGKTEIMLLNAKIMEMKSEKGRTFTSVFYDGQIRRGETGDQPEYIRAVWEFSRDDTVESGLWILEKINKVDQ